MPVGNVLQDFVSRHYGQMDEALWNAFLTAAGRASQLDRALHALKQMQAIIPGLSALRLSDLTKGSGCIDTSIPAIQIVQHDEMQTLPALHAMG